MARLARVACRAAAWVAFVDGAVAIVVEAIASFRRGLHALLARKCASGTMSHAGRAHARQAGAACRAAAGIALIDAAVAIVVDAIADFRSTRIDQRRIVVAIGGWQGEEIVRLFAGREAVPDVAVV